MTPVELAAIAMVLVGLVAATLPARRRVNLDGEWECVFGEADAPPGADAAWERTAVPSTRPWNEDGPHCLWYRRQFRLPSDWAGSRVVLRIGAIRFGQGVYVNGVEVGRHLGGYEPTEYDVTGAAAPDRDSEIRIAAQDFTCLIAPDAQVGKRERWHFFGQWVNEGILYPIGSSGAKVGIWESVCIEARPDVWIEDVFVITSVREKRLSLRVTVGNSARTAENVSISAVIAEGAGPAIPPREVMLGAGERRTVSLEAEWADARLWSPSDPQLHHVRVIARTARHADEREVRFGFREFWIEGDRFLLNGIPINLPATSLHSFSPHPEDPAAAYAIARQANCAAVRLHTEPWPGRWYDVADEIGMPLVWESAYYALSTKYGGAMRRPEYWENMRAHIAAQLKLHRNHPSVLIWSAENELLLCETSIGKEAEQRLGEIADFMRQLDPTRPIMFEGDDDPVGKADIVNLHYPHELPKWNLYPETAYWFEAPVVTDMYPNREWFWDHKKPLYLGEVLWVPGMNVHAGSVFFGDAAYPETDTYRALAKTIAWEMQIIAARDAGVNGISPWVLFEGEQIPAANMRAHRRGYQPIAAFAKEMDVHAFSESVAERTVMVFNDTPQKRDLELRWSLSTASEDHDATGSARVSLDPAGRTRVTADVSVPPTEVARTPARFALELWEGGSKVFSETRDWRIYQRGALLGPVPGAPTGAAIYDPEGETCRVLSDLGVECLPVTASDARRVLGRHVAAVIGKGALSHTMSKALQSRLLRFVRDGGTLLVFEQERYPESLIPLTVTDHGSTVAFPRCPGHPVLDGLGAEDLAHWLPDGMVGGNEIAKPVAGGFLPIVDSGGEDGLVTASLAELRTGGGRMVLCQLEVTSRFGLHPISTRLVRNMLAFSTRRLPRPAATGVLCDDVAAAVLDRIGLRYRRLTSPVRRSQLSRLDVVVVCEAGQLAEARAELEAFVRTGGRAVLHGIEPATAALAQEVLGVRFDLSADCDGAISLEHREGLASGISNFDLAWYGGPGEGEVAAPLVRADIADHPLVLGEAGDGAADAPTAYTRPCVLASAGAGAGVWVIDQVRWDRALRGREQVSPEVEKAFRYVAMLLTNLGCAFDPPALRGASRGGSAAGPPSSKERSDG